MPFRCLYDLSCPSLPVTFANAPLVELPVRVAGQLGNEFDCARALIAGEVSPAVLDELGPEVGAGRDAGGGLDDRLDLLTELVVGNTEHRRVDEFGMHDQQVLRLLRVDVHPTR